MTPDYIEGLDDPADAPPHVETLEERLLAQGFSQEEIDRSLAEPEIFAKLPRKA